jgi:hypothetical protein
MTAAQALIQASASSRKIDIVFFSVGKPGTLLPAFLVFHLV